MNILAINGNEDEIVDFKRAKSQYEKLNREGHNVKFVEFNESGHALEKNRERLGDLIASFFAGVNS